ncbi:nucleotidyltransferase family protein [[Clostridium] aminophilum]|uniref:Nucleotidyl transferase n=1 Tax=[Clostridium] aminophilum TaxID=1526 RepID=A0A1I6IYC8_9FIRM|nr:sugar phosphate nucleotidyltransferase [[Clostridium] aminophilum]SFR71756.1 Nucleotidyl transferase [[Clostridium] aminophilum]
MKDTALVIMAAGIGSRFGGGIKQLTPMGPNGEIIMDYSIHDAIDAGFNRVVFIIRKDLEADFREIVGDRIAKIIPVAYAYQEVDDLPEGYTAPEDRKKPWGTGHAVLAVRGIVHEPFLVINADDYYGKEGFRRIHDYMVHEMDENAEYIDMCMGGFMLKNTLSENGGVARGVCEVREDGTLARVTETYNIRRTENGMEATDAEGNPVTVREDQHVSMNMWGLTPRFLDVLAEGFPKFLDGLSEEGRKKAEYLLPAMIDEQIQNGTGRVRVLETPDRWFGVTYKEDRESVTAAFARLIAEGVYPEKLYS